MERAIDRIIDGSVEAEQAEGRQTIAEFTEGTEERVRASVDALREALGDDAQELLQRTEEAFKEYKHETLARFDATHAVDAIAKEEGAAGLNEKGNGNLVVIDFEGVERQEDPARAGYWERVGKHEEVHQQEQATNFNLGEIIFRGRTIDVVPVLVEWGAISGALQPESDLTPEYREHRRLGEELAAVVGAKTIRTALRTGDMLALQKRIDAIEAAAIRQRLLTA